MFVSCIYVSFHFLHRTCNIYQCITSTTNTTSHHLSSKGKGKRCPNSCLYLKIMTMTMTDRHGGQWGSGWLKLCAEVELGAIRTLENASTEKSCSLTLARKRVFSTEPLTGRQKVAELFNRRIDCALETVRLGSSAQRGCLKCRARNTCVFCLRMCRYHIQTPGGHWLDESIPLATLSVGQEVCMYVSVRVDVCVIIIKLSFYIPIFCVFVPTCLCERRSASPTQDVIHPKTKQNEKKEKTAANHRMYYLSVCVCV